jgi:hypothetical protein
MKRLLIFFAVSALAACSNPAPPKAQDLVGAADGGNDQSGSGGHGDGAAGSRAGSGGHHAGAGAAGTDADAGADAHADSAPDGSVGDVDAASVSDSGEAGAGGASGEGGGGGTGGSSAPTLLLLWSHRVTTSNATPVIAGTTHFVAYAEMDKGPSWAECDSVGKDESLASGFSGTRVLQVTGNSSCWGTGNTDPNYDRQVSLELHALNAANKETAASGDSPQLPNDYPTTVIISQHAPLELHHVVKKFTWDGNGLQYDATWELYGTP